LIQTALLICLENSFWNISRDGVNFVESFIKSFSLYVESGMRKEMEAEIDILGNDEGGFLVTKDLKAQFRKIITEHYLCKIHLLLFTLKISNHFLCLNTARPATEDQAFGLNERME
jgi:hypothetical protein